MGNINTSTIKKLVTQSGFRCGGSAIVPLRDAIEKYASELVERAKEFAEKDKRKTIMSEDIDKALNEEDTEEEEPEEEDSEEESDEDLED